MRNVKKSFVAIEAGPAPAYRKECEQVAAKGYEGFVLQ